MRLKFKFSLAMLLVFGGVLHQAVAQADEPRVVALRKAGEVKASLASAPPFIVISPSGEATGYTPELVNMVLKNMSLPAFTPVQLAWRAQIPALQAHQIDFIAAGFLISSENCATMLFAAPLFAMRGALYVRAGNPKSLKSIEQFAGNPDLKLGVVSGGIAEKTALEKGVKPAQIVRVPDFQAGIASVTGGRADALVLGEFAITDPGQKGLEVVVDESAPVEGYAPVFRREDASFRDAFNKQLNGLRNNGTMKDLYAVKYGVSNWDTLAKLTKASDVVPGCE